MKPLRQSLIIVAYGTGLVLGAFLLYSVRWILLLFLIGVFWGTILIPLSEFLCQKLRIPKGISALLLLVSVLGAAVALLYISYTLLTEDFAKLLSELPQNLDQARTYALERLRQVPWIDTQSLQNLNLSATLTQAVETLGRGLRLGGTAIAGILFVTATALYIATNPSRYYQSLLSIFPAYMRNQMADLLQAWAQSLRYWFFAQLTIMACVAAATALALWIVGIHYWLLYGIIAGLLDIVPYIGPLVSAGVISLITLGSQPDKFIWVLVAFVVIQQIENYLIAPLVFKGRVELPPAYLLCLMFAMGQWFGILGIIIAPAFMALFRTYMIRVYIPKMDEKTRPETLSRSA